MYYSSLFLVISNPPFYSFQVTVNHVERAAKLLTKSIIRVEQPEVLLEDDDDDVVFHTSQQVG